MVRSPISERMKIVIGVASVVVCLLFYLWLSHRQHVINPKDTTMPNLVQLWDGVLKICTPSSTDEIWLWVDIKATAIRLFLGLAVGVFASMVLGIGMACWKPLHAFLAPPVKFLSKIPPTAMMAVYFVLFGTELQMFVAMIAFGIAPTLTLAIYQSVMVDVQDHLLYKAYTLGASHLEVVWDVIYRQILPRIIDNVSLMVGPAFVFLIAAEWMMADEGFGYRLRIQSRLLNMNVVYMYLIVLGIWGYGMTYGLQVLRQKLCPWFKA